MKKRVFSLFLAAVMLFSVLSVAVAAEGDDTTTETVTNAVAANVKGLTVNIDGVRDAGEGWSAKPTFQTKYKVSDPSGVFKDTNDDGILDTPDTESETKDGEAIVVDENPSSLYISTDGKYLYVYYESTHADYINGPNSTTWNQVLQWNGATAWGASTLSFNFAPIDKANEESGVEDQESFFIKLATYPDDSYANNVIENALIAEGGNQTYIWDHKMGDENKAENGGAWDASQSWSARYLVQSYRNGQKQVEGTGVTMSNYGVDVRNDTHIALRVEGEHSNYTKLCVEMAFPLSEALGEKLLSGTADYRIAAYEQCHFFDEAPITRNGVTSSNGLVQNAGYVISDRTYSYSQEEVGEVTFPNWCFPTTCGVAITLPSTAEEASKIAEPVTFGTITVDGQMGAGEGWSVSPMFQTSVYATDCKLQDEATLKWEDNSPSTVRISTDGQKVYFFIEVTHEETLNAAWRDIDPDPVAVNWQTAALVLHFYPDNDTPRSSYGADNGRWFTLGLASFATSALKDSNFDENGTYVWDMNVEQGAVTGQSSDFFWRFLWGSEGANTYSKDFCLNGVELAAHIDKNEEGKRTKLSVEFAFPLAEDVVAELEDGDLPYKFTYWERNNVYKDPTDENATEVIKRDAGYFLNDTPVDTRVKSDDIDFGMPVLLRQNTEGEYTAFVKWLKEYKESAAYDNLKNLVVNMLGDDYLTGGKIANYYKWMNILDEAYNWNITDYSEDGMMMSTYDDIQLFPLSRSYRSMSSNNPHVVLVSGGWNDYLNGVPIGTIEDTKADTYMGALNTLIDGLHSKYPDACIIFTTPYNATATVEGSTLTTQDYATAMKQACEAKYVYCFDAYDTTVSGIDMSSAEFREAYCMAADNVTNLNLEGNKLLLAKYEKFISDSLTHWAANKDEIKELLKPAETPNDGGNTGNSTDNGNTNTNTETQATPSTPAQPEKKGCGGVIGVGSAFAVLAMISCAGAVCFKKHN